MDYERTNGFVATTPGGNFNFNDITMSSPKLTNRETEINTRHINNYLNDTGKSVPSPKFNAAASFSSSEMFIEPVDEENCNDRNSTWEYHNVSLNRIPGYGFGIAVSGGRDNPHFKSGDPSIVISDVLRAGPAWGLLELNDRIISANGLSLENADYTTAVQIMKDSEQLNLIVKRRVPLPVIEFEQRTLKFTLTKSKKKDDFGIVLGCKFYVKDITNKKLAEKDPGLKEGDVVLKINDQNCDDLTLSDARKLLDKSRERLSLIVQRDVPRGTNWKWSSQATLYERLGSDTPRQSPTPRASPMVQSRYSDDTEATSTTPRLNNAVRMSGRYPRYGSSTDYINSPPKRHSFGSQPPSRSRTPSQSLYDDYGRFSPKSWVAQTPPRAITPGDESARIPAAVHINTADPSAAQKPPLPSPLPEPRFVSFMKEGGSVGVRVIGGNEVGIFVSAIQAGSPAALKGVRTGDKILRVNDRDMRNVTREDAVLHLLSLADQVDLIVQHRRDDFERVRTQNVGDNFYVRVHFDYDKTENGELQFRNGDIFQIIDTLYGGTVGSWQAVRVLSPALGEKNETPSSKGVIPNATRAEQLANGRCSRANGGSDGSRSTGSLLRKKMTTIGRRSKSLTKGHWDEVVFSQGTMKFPAYERVKLRHPGFLRPVVLFGGLADVAREKLLQDFPLRFAAPQTEIGDENAKNSSSSSSSIIRLSSIREVMNKNKHCLLDVTPSSIEKLQYAQYCPIVVFINVDSRTRLRDLRRRHSKLAASKNSRKLLEESMKIQKMCGYLFTAVLDASHQDEWFEGLRELISHLQERRVWMAETRPADLLDDDFLFPMANNRFSNYTTDSDAESLKGDLSDYGTLPGTTRNSSRHESNNVSTDVLNRNGDEYADYLQHDTAQEMIPNGINCRLSAVSSELPPPGDSPRKIFTPSSAIRQQNNSFDVLVVPSSSSTSSFKTDSADLHATISCSVKTNTPPVVSVAGGYVGGRTMRHLSEPGFYDVKQILAGHVDDYGVPNYASQSPLLPPNSVYAPGMFNGGVGFNHGIYEYVPNRTIHPVDQFVSSSPRPYVPYGVQNGPPPPGRYVHQNSVPASMQQTNFDDAIRGAPAYLARANPVSRTASMPASSGNVYGPFGAAARTPPSTSTLTNGYDYGGNNCNNIANRRLASSSSSSSAVAGRSPVPPPAPAPRSPHPYSPRMSLTSGATVMPVSLEEDEDVTPSPPYPHQMMQQSTSSHSNSRTPTLPPAPNSISVVTTRSTNGDARFSEDNCTSPSQGSTSDSPRKCFPPTSTTTTTNDKSPGGLDLANREKHGGSAFELYTKNGPTTDGCSSTNSKLTNLNDTHKVLAHITALVGPEGGVLTSEATGVSIKIPPGALQNKHEVFFKVFQDSRLEPPLDKEKGETMLSPLLMCGPQGLKFSRPVELLLPYTAAGGLNSGQWSFAVKTASSTNGGDGGHVEWKQIALSDLHEKQTNGGGCTKLNDKFASILIDRF